MAHWLEDSEREERKKKRKPARESARIQDKMFRIKKNYEKNKDIYEEFIAQIHNLVERVNNLPAEKREPFKYLEAKAKESKLGNHLYIFSSSERAEKRIATKSFPFYKNQYYKHIRIIYFCISKEMDMAEIEVKENYLAKTRMKSHGSEEHDIDLLDDGLTRVDVLFLYKIKKLNKDLAFRVLDWIAFKEDLNYLPFTEEDFKYHIKHKKPKTKS